MDPSENCNVQKVSVFLETIFIIWNLLYILIICRVFGQLPIYCICFSHDIGSMSWKQVNEKYSRYENILHVIDLVLTLPASSAMCERGFSYMKVMKSSARNKLSSAQMSRLMTIMFHSDNIQDFNPTPAIHQWNKSSQRARRVDFMDISITNPHAITNNASEEGNAEEPVDKEITPLDSDYDSQSEEDVDEEEENFSDLE